MRKSVKIALIGVVGSMLTFAAAAIFLSTRSSKPTSHS